MIIRYVKNLKRADDNKIYSFITFPKENKFYETNIV